MDGVGHRRGRLDDARAPPDRRRRSLACSSPCARGRRASVRRRRSAPPRAPRSGPGRARACSGCTTSSGRSTSRPGRTRSSSRATSSSPTCRGTSSASSPTSTYRDGDDPARGRDPPAPRRLDLQLRAAVRGRRGEDDRHGAEGYGWRYDPQDSWVMNHMIHNLTPDGDAGLHHLRPRLHPGRLAGRRRASGT